MKFEEWVFKQGGIRDLARKLQITPMTIVHWFNKDCFPSALTLQKLVKMSKGKLTYDSIIDSIKKRK